MRMKSLLGTSILALLATGAQASAATYSTYVSLTCNTSGQNADGGLFPTLEFDVTAQGAPVVEGGSADAQYKQNGSSVVTEACGAEVQGSHASCTFEANHQSGQYFFTVTYSGYTDANGNVFEPSTAQTSCVLPY